jgi:hypothetical protein
VPISHYNKKSKDNVLRIENDIRALRAQDKSNDEVMAILKIPLRSYRRYCSSIAKQDREIWDHIVEQELASEFLKLRESLNHSYKIAKQLSEDSKLECEDRLAALESKDQSRINLVELMIEGPKYITKVKSQTQSQSQPYIEKYEWKENAEEVLQNETE